MSPSRACASSTAGARAGCTPQEIGQIGGRAGRYRRDGTFGVTGDAPEIDADVAAAVEAHAFAPVAAAEWRNARLDFDSLAGLMRSLSLPPPHAGLRLAEEAQDEATLRQLGRGRTGRPPRRRPRQPDPALGSLPDPGFPQDHAGRTHPAGRRRSSSI